MSDTTEPQGPLTIDSALEQMFQTEEPETEAVEEAEDTQPEVDESDEVEEVAEEEGDDIVEDDEEESEYESDDEDEDYDDEEAEASSEDQSFTVKVDGELKTVTLDELKRGYSGQQYVQKGMQEVAEQRKQFEAMNAQIAQERQALAQLLQSAQQGELTPPKEPDSALLEQDPISYWEQRIKFEAETKEYETKAAQVKEQMQKAQQQQQQAMQQQAQIEAQKLMEVVPELKDSKKAQVFKERLVKVAQDAYGYTPEEIAMVNNHRDFLVLRDAMLYREMQAGKASAKGKAKKPKAPIKAGAKKVNTKGREAQKQRQKLKQTGSISDAMSLMFTNN